MTDVIFLLCSERSGSNLISRIFGAHPDLCAPGPAHLLRVFGENAHRYEHSDVGWRDFSTDLQDLFAAKVSNWALDEHPGKRLSELSESRDIARCLIDVYCAEADKCGKPALFIKENQIYNFLPFVLTAVDRLRFLYLVRDPRDMALSWLRSPLIRGGAVRAAQVWAHDQENFLKLLAWLEPAYLTASMTYEALLSEPEEVLKCASDQLQLTYDPAMLVFNRSHEAVVNSAASIDWRNTGKPLLTDNAGKFRQALSAEQLAYIEYVCAPLMDVLGYQRETPGDAPFGAYGSFEELAQAMNAVEPWDKPGYADVPEQEKAQRNQWVTVRERIVQRPICVPGDFK